jgi:hypothetical protein
VSAALYIISSIELKYFRGCRLNAWSNERAKPDTAKGEQPIRRLLDGAADGVIAMEKAGVFAANTARAEGDKLSMNVQ